MTSGAAAEESSKVEASYERSGNHRFIPLRAQGWTFDRMAAELKVSQPTLIHWSPQPPFDLQNLRAVATGARAEKYFADVLDGQVGKALLVKFVRIR